MQTNRSVRNAALAFCLVFGSACPLVGCGSGDSEAKPAPVNAEAQKATNEMLRNYGSQQAEMYRAKAAAKHKAQ
jgi:hypothetical protein